MIKKSFNINSFKKKRKEWETIHPDPHRLRLVLMQNIEL